MISDTDIKVIKNTVKRSLENNCVGFNGVIDDKKLINAIAIAIAAAIKQYDEQISQ